MKRNDIVVYFLLIMLLIYLFVLNFVVTQHYLSYIYIISTIFFGIMALVSYKLLGIPKKKSSISYSVYQTIIISVIVYYIITYIFGLFTGFLTSAYSLKFLSILKNVLSVLFLYYFKEVFRFSIVNTKGKLKIVIVTLFLTMFDILMTSRISGMNGYVEIFEFIEAIVVPKLALNILLTYISYKMSYKHALAFLLLYTMPSYFLPIVPDFGKYLSTVISLVFFFICYYKLSLVFEKYERKQVSTHKSNKFLIAILVIPLFIFAGLVSGIFKYHLVTIASNSMLPKFARGDAVLIKKLEKEDYPNIKTGDILAFNYNNMLITHRVVSVTYENGAYSFKTKGDNNDIADGWVVKENMIYGEVKSVVKYIGIPSVELWELINE
ncbi:MAG: signal peptidase I [bacterium]|nr:signal peptidase I [bacterium]